MASTAGSKLNSHTIDIEVLAHPGKLGLRLKYVKEGAEVLCVDDDSPLKGVIYEKDVILTLNGEPLVNKNQFHTFCSRTLGIRRQIDTYLRLEAEKLKSRKRDMRDIPLSTKAIPFLELYRYNSIAINSGIEYDTQYIGATPTSALCKQYASFIADEANCVNIHNIEYIMLHYDCRYGKTGMMMLMMGANHLNHADTGITSFIRTIIEDRHESCRRKEKSCALISILEYLFTTIEMFYEIIMEEKSR
jgi:hypothetical protein